MKREQTRTRIFSHITRTRFLHLEDSLDIGKIRFFIGQYKRRDRGGDGAEAVAFHFLDLDDARPLMADLSWNKATDFVDFKGTANGGQPQSRVLKVRGPKDGKYWLEIANGPGQIIGEGAVKPAGDPDASISIALSIWEARALALACIEYMSAWRVAAMIGTGSRTAGGEAGTQRPEPLMYPGAARLSAADAEDLFGPEPARAGPDPEPKRAEKPAPAPVIASEAKQSPPAEDKPAIFYELAPVAIQEHGLLDLVQELVRAPLSWAEKTQRLQAAMAA